MGQIASGLSEDDTRMQHNLTFRVLIIGRANAGKTSILQRVCDTTESPRIYRRDQRGRRERVQLDPTIERGMHNIDDELTFTNHTGYIFHDSRGFEAGAEDELKIVQQFVRRKSRERQLKDRLHAIWYCVPMDNARPELDIKYFDDICPDKNVPVIAVFTKYDQFRRDIRIKLEDQHRDPSILDAEVESVFEEHYLADLTGPTPFICLERMHKPGQRCNGLIEITADTLSDGVVALMLLAVQRDNNLELSINYAIRKAHSTLKQGRGNTENVIKLCILAFPSLWFSKNLLDKGYRPRETDDKFWQKSREWCPDSPDMVYSDRDNLLFTLTSFFANTFPISDDDIHHIMIVTILVLDHASLSHASSYSSTPDKALKNACFQYMASHIHDKITNQFTAPPGKYSISQFNDFILQHCVR